MYLLDKTPVRRAALARARKVLLVAAVCAVALLLSACGGGATPDLTGLTLSEAQAVAEGAGLQLVEGERLPSFLPADTVLAQDPLPGAPSADGTVEVMVSRDPIAVKVRKIDPRDPEGDDHEKDRQLPNLYDGDLNTYWETEAYRTPDFAGYGDKIGVGFSFFLEEAATMLKIDYTITGWEGEVQMVSSDELAVALAELGVNRQVSWQEPITEGRIWFNQLALMPGTNTYGVRINEVTFYR